VVVLVCESSDSNSSKTVTVHSLYFDRTKECNASLDGAKMVVLFTRECIVLPKCNELYVSLLYFGAFVQAQVKAFALHTSGNSARYFHQPVTSYHSFVLTRSRFYTFVQTKNKEHEAICNSNRRIYEYRIIPHWHVTMSKVKTTTFVFSSRFVSFHIENILILI